MPEANRRRLSGAAVLLALLLPACSGSYVVERGGVYLAPDPVVVAPAPPRRAPPGRGPAAAHVDIPPGHYPPPGACRVWFPDRPPGQQPPPGSCNVRVPHGAVLIQG